MAELYPSLISADLLHLQDELDRLNAHCAGYHLDVMDFHFVPNLTWGPAFINALAAATPKKIWVHLMVENPTAWFSKMSLPAHSIVSIHIESEKDILHAINSIKENNWRPSLAISPKTAPEEIFPFLQHIDHVLIMSVEPGFSGQQFLPSVSTKIKVLRDYCADFQLNITLALDGGINKNNIAQLAHAGVNDFAVAAGIFATTDPVATLQELQKKADAPPYV